MQLNDAKPLLSQYMTTDELSKELNVSPNTLSNWRREGKGPPVSRIGARPAYRRGAVIEWMDSAAFFQSSANKKEAKSAPSENSGILADYLTDVQLAAQLGVCSRSLARWRRLKEGPPVTKMGRKVLYRRDAVAKWLEQRGTE